MLQQTQVARVLPKYELFLTEFPTVARLAEAPDAKLLLVWEGIGYWRRVLYLRNAAKMIVDEFEGVFPSDTPTLQSLPGVGPYTANAVACFAFGSAEPFLDTNIRRVYLHFFFPDGEGVPDSQIMDIAREAVRSDNPREWHYALFDYGAMVLRDSKINRRSSHYSKQSAFDGSFRSFRTKAVRHLLTRPGNVISQAELNLFLAGHLAADDHPYAPQEVIDALVKDGLLKTIGDTYSL
jgi:A/G-specific adenine glycosylase